jgi:hypothetical protein
MASARAQQATRYYADGISIDYPGWEVSDIAGAGNPSDVLTIAPINMRQSGVLRVCSLKKSDAGLPPTLTREAANQRAALFTRENAERVFGEQTRIESVTHTIVDGVAVIDITASANPTGPYVIRERGFVVILPDGPAQFLLECVAMAPMNDSQRADMDAILSSLRFVPVR